MTVNNECEQNCRHLLDKFVRVRDVIDFQLLPQYNASRYGTPERTNLHNQYLMLDNERDSLLEIHKECIEKCRKQSSKGGGGSKRNLKSHHRVRRLSKKTKKTRARGRGRGRHH